MSSTRDIMRMSMSEVAERYSHPELVKLLTRIIEINGYQDVKRALKDAQINVEHKHAMESRNDNKPT